MSDVLVTCPQCHRESKVSEYAAMESLTCPACGHRLSMPSGGSKKSSKLNLKAVGENEVPHWKTPKEHPEPVVSANHSSMRMATERNNLVGSEAPPEQSTESLALNPTAIGDVHITHERARTPRIVWGWLAFLIIGGAMVGLQYKMGDVGEFREYHYWARAVLWGLTAITTYVAAFEDSTFQGIFCLIFPPYAVYYVLVRSDSYVLRGVMMALLVSLGAELHFLEGDATVVHIQNTLNNFVTGGETLIIRAGDAPTF